ncbi:hypothetical protein B0J12DRAFT_429863 [Macrophomina phaseolina]|uniref:Uncharacterized protein n=1 Tax=Macrophomina phaseolina TaxID=35725 RepID=A0ABQ8GH17_9PEZI|nr:hypothetical protein B0J12DRAFT_429863 [Macrophomina phaseolina]
MMSIMRLIHGRRRLACAWPGAPKAPWGARVAPLPLPTRLNCRPPPVLAVTRPSTAVVLLTKPSRAVAWFSTGLLSRAGHTHCFKPSFVSGSLTVGQARLAPWNACWDPQPAVHSTSGAHPGQLPPGAYFRPVVLRIRLAIPTRSLGAGVNTALVWPQKGGKGNAVVSPATRKASVSTFLHTAHPPSRSCRSKSYVLLGHGFAPLQPTLRCLFCTVLRRSGHRLSASKPGTVSSASR